MMKQKPLGKSDLLPAYIRNHLPFREARCQWSKLTKQGTITGILLGGITVIIWKQLGVLGGIFDLYTIVPGFLAGTVGACAVSLITQNRLPDIAKSEFKRFVALM